MKYLVEMVLITFIIVILALGIASQVKAHDWYDYDCCSGNDCAPVTNIRFFQDTSRFPPVNYVELETKYGKDTVNLSTFPQNGIRASQDDQYHACMLPLGDHAMEHTPQMKPSEGKTVYTRCIYFPARM